MLWFLPKLKKFNNPDSYRDSEPACLPAGEKRILTKQTML